MSRTPGPESALPVEPLPETSWRRGRRQEEETDIDITPMIDMTFLLLIFFLVTSRINTQGAVDLPQAHHGTAVPEKNSVIITIVQADGGSSRVYRGKGSQEEQLFSAPNLVQEEAAIGEYLQQELTRGSGKDQVLIYASRGVKHREVSRVSSIVGRATSAKLYVAVLEVQ